MTSQEAREQLNVCESQITGTYSNLRNTARSMGSSAVKAASGETTKDTLLPLIILSIFGLMLCIASHPAWGILLIIVGIVIAYNTHQSAKSAQTTVENQQKYLNSVIDNNATI